LNEEELDDRYDVSLEECHFLVDFDNGKYTQLEPDYKAMDGWSVVSKHPFLDASESKNALFRAFYVPFLDDQYCK